MALDLKDDYKVFDGLENVTVDGAAVSDVLRLDEFDTEGEPTEGIYLHSDVEFQIRTTAGVVPLVGQVIVDGGGRSYNILAIREPQFGDYYGCVCRRIAIEAGLPLASKITLYPAFTTIDEYGHRSVSNGTPSFVFFDVPCRIQDVTAEVGEVMGKRGFKRVFHITCAVEIDLEHGDVLKDETGMIYDIISWRNRSRIDELSLIVCGIPV